MFPGGVQGNEKHRSVNVRHPEEEAVADALDYVERNSVLKEVMC